jgi:branched-chain amino acid transport system substrate-binding protein
MFIQVIRAAMVATLALASATGDDASAQERNSIKIGWAVSKTGPYTPGSSITLLPSYQLWVKDVNDAGGIALKELGKRVPIEVVEYDDRSNSEEAVRAIERLATQDKVDLILAPWGTALNLAVGPTFNRLGYPQIAVTVVSDRIVGLAKRWPNSSYWNATSTHISNAGVEVLTKARDAGQIGKRVALIGVADQFGIELTTAARDGLKKAGFEIVYDRSYPAGSQDLQPIMNEVVRTSPDAFIAYSYPTDTFLITEQSKLLNFNPTIFMVGVGAAFPVFKQKFGGDTQGVMGVGGWDAEAPALKAFLKRHTELHNREPDRWASPLVYASLQALQQAIERVGKIDRAAIIKEIQNGSFDTIIGRVTLKDGIFRDGWGVGQWQDGEYYGIAPTHLQGARKPMIPKPAWK